VKRGQTPFSALLKRGLTPFFLAFLSASAPPTGLGYDAQADTLQQLDAAKIRARGENKRILVVAGGDWCGACHRLHEFLEDDDKTAALLDGAFVQVHVYLGAENFNESFFATLPPTRFVPHYWVLSADGTVPGERSTEELEIDGSDDYDPDRFADFVARFGT
jgi:hypothetical protein